MIAIIKVLFRCVPIGTILIFLLGKTFDPRRFLQSLAVPLQSISSDVTRRTKDCFLKIQSKDKLITLLKDLSNENATLRLQLQQTFDLQDQLTSLRALTQINQQLPCGKIFAQVIKRDVSAWFESITLNKGKTNGVRENAIVIANCGILGKITEVFENFSIATLISSPKFRLAACFEWLKIPMIFSGNGSSYVRNSLGKYEFKPSGTLRNIPLDAESRLAKGTRVIGAALMSNVPDDLTIGFIEGIQPSQDGMFLTAEVALSKELYDIHTVLILAFGDL